jgi:FixJ family two-component response regulator
VILDVIMPKKSGREVHDMVKEHRPELPVLFHSGYSYDVIGEDHLPDSHYHLIQKPYLPRDLLRQVRLLLQEYGV